jgi:sulfoxide reductase heme-binding subunit YedZ
MVRVQPIHYVWWLVSRASGVVAFGMISASVLIGLTMATKLATRPAVKRRLPRVHEHAALVGLTAIAVHGLSLLGDAWLHPGLRGLVVPFAMTYRPLYTGLGVVGGYLAALFGLSFYVRRRIGTALWRKLHRGTVVVWVLSVAHTIGSGTDAGTLWLRLILLASGAPIVFLALVRILQGYGDPQSARSPSSSSTDTPRRLAAEPPLTASASVPRASV